MTNSLVANASVLQESRAWSEESVNELTMMATALVELLNNTLDLAKLEQGKMEFHRSFEPIFKIVEMALSVSKTPAGQKHLRLTHNYAQSLPSLVEVDRARLTQVVINLVSNAVKFTQAHGTVAVRVGWFANCGINNGNCETCPWTLPHTAADEEQNDPLAGMHSAVHPILTT